MNRNDYKMWQNGKRSKSGMQMLQAGRMVFVCFLGV